MCVAEGLPGVEFDCAGGDGFVCEEVEELCCCAIDGVCVAGAEIGVLADCGGDSRNETNRITARVIPRFPKAKAKTFPILRF